MKAKLVIFVLMLVGAAAHPAAAGILTQDWKTCLATCETIAEECQFVNDLETCARDNQACKVSCDERNPALAICVEQCESLALFCHHDGVSKTSTCRDENRVCVDRCEQAIVSNSR